MLRRFKGGATVTCDVQGCTRSFRSFSRATLVRGQASSDGWTFEKIPPIASSKIDRCPECSVAAKARAAKADAPAPAPAPVPVSIVAAAEPEKLVSRDSDNLTTETISLVSGQPEGVASGAETVGDDRPSPSAVVAPRKRRAKRETLAVVPEPESESKARRGRPRLEMPGTLAIVVEILREVAQPLSAREIVERAGARLAGKSKSKTPHTVVSRDLSLAVKHGGEASIFVRTAPGRFTLRELALASAEVAA